MELAIAHQVNGMGCCLIFDPRTTLLDALCERLRITGLKQGCDQGQFGVCTILLDERRVISCLALAVAPQDAGIVTNADEGTIAVTWIDDNAHVNSMGAKEIGIVGTAAIGDAGYQASAIRVRDLPITLDKLLSYSVE
jgi:hypothetical protein